MSGENMVLLNSLNLVSESDTSEHHNVMLFTMLSVVPEILSFAVISGINGERLIADC